MSVNAICISRWDVIDLIFFINQWSRPVVVASRGAKSHFKTRILEIERSSMQESKPESKPERGECNWFELYNVGIEAQSDSSKWTIIKRQQQQESNTRE